MFTASILTFTFYNFFLVLLGLASGVIVLYHPKLGLPNSQTFQLLESEHPFELYDTKYKNMFRFERTVTVNFTMFFTSSKSNIQLKVIQCNIAGS